MKSGLQIALLLVGLVTGYRWLSSDSVAIAAPDGTLTYPGYEIRALDSFDLSGRVLSRHDYTRGREADLSRTDLAIGWGPMADPAILASIDVSQSNRWFFWHADRLPIPRVEIERHAANIHIVPASETVARRLDDVATNDLVRLEGDLVEIRAEDGWRWRSSLSRTDTGNHSCEVLLLREVTWL